MLILSRRVGESVYLPSIDATVTVQKTSAGRVVLGIEAPRDVPVVRQEIVEEKTASEETAEFPRSETSPPLLSVRQPSSGYIIGAPSIGFA